MDVYSPWNHNRATGSWRRNRNLKINIYKSAKLHKTSTPEQCTFEMPMTLFSGPPHLLALLNSTFKWFSRQRRNNWPYQTKTFIRLFFFFQILWAQNNSFILAHWSKSDLKSHVPHWLLHVSRGGPTSPSSLTIKAQAIKAPPQIKPTFILWPCFLGHKLHSFGIWLLVAAVWWGK